MMHLNCARETLESPLDSEEIKPVSPERHKPCLRAQWVKNPPAVQETLGQFLGQRDLLQKG